MRRTFRAALVLTTTLTLALAMTGVASSSVKSRLATQLISRSQFPGGWSIQNPSGAVQAGCLTNVVGLSKYLVAKGVKQTSSARVFLEDDQSVPMVSEMLATYSNADAAYLEIVSTLVRCKHIGGKIFGQAVSGSLKQKSFPHFGNESQTFAATTSILGTNFDEDVTIVRKGNVVMGIIEGGLPPVSAHQFQGFIVKALARVP
jgi:hypothetical protein